LPVTVCEFIVLLLELWQLEIIKADIAIKKNVLGIC